mgnify:FL=1
MRNEYRVYAVNAANNDDEMFDKISAIMRSSLDDETCAVAEKIDPSQELVLNPLCALHYHKIKVCCLYHKFAINIKLVIFLYLYVFLIKLNEKRVLPHLIWLFYSNNIVNLFDKYQSEPDNLSSSYILKLLWRMLHG